MKSSPSGKFPPYSLEPSNGSRGGGRGGGLLLKGRILSQREQILSFKSNPIEKGGNISKTVLLPLEMNLFA